LPWSTCPIVPMFTCGFDLSNFSFAISFPASQLEETLDPYSRATLPMTRATTSSATLRGASA